MLFPPLIAAAVSIECTSIKNTDSSFLLLQQHQKNFKDTALSLLTTLKMPASAASTPKAVVTVGLVDNRAQPWKKLLASANYTKAASSSSDKEIIKTGGPCDVLTNFFSV